MRILRKLLLIAPALAVLGAVLLGVPEAGAQERQVVDLELSITNRDPESERAGVFVATVRNNSDVTVRDIKVQFEVEDIALGKSIFLEEHTITNRENDGTVDYDTLEWTISGLRPGVRALTRLSMDNSKTNDGLSATEFSLVRFQGAIVESTPREAPGQLGNSRARHFTRTYRDSRAITILFGINVSYGVDADPGTDTFTVRVTNPSRKPGAWRGSSVDQYQLRLKVTPSPGLRYTGAPSAGTTFDPATGIWDIAHLPGGASPRGNKRLDIRVTGRGNLAVPEEDQCLTVEIDHVIPDPEIGWLPVTACMAHKALVTEGEFGIFTWYNCLAGSGYPCGSQSSLELAAVKPAHSSTRFYIVDQVHRQRFRSDEFRQGTNNMILQPEDLVVQVPDNSLTRVTESGNTVWSTVDHFNLYIHQDMPQAGFDSSWSGFKESVTVSGADGAASPGRWRMGLPDDSITFLDAADSTRVEGDPYPFSYIPADDGITGFKLEFGALGTYSVLFEIEATKSGTTYSDSGTYTFHVGPVAELEVRDDPAHSLAEPGQRAYTVVAVNQGPDTAPAVRVRLTGVPEGAEAVTTRGEYAHGSCGEDGLCQGVWTIGEMVDAASRSAEGRNEGEVLTIIPPSSGGGPITAAIENTQDYSVTIDGTTHTASYYDYLDHNDAAEVALRPAPSAGPPSRPERPTVIRLPSFALVQWPPLEYLNGFRVTHYEVQRSASPWETVADDVGGGVYVDTDVRPGQLTRYRVRAVNEAGGSSYWSLPMNTGPDAPGDFTAEQLQNGEVRLTWTKPDGNGADITGYTIQVSTNAGGSWAGTGARPGADDTSWVHRNLSVGPVRLYRIRASTANGPGPWAQATSAEVGRPFLIANYDGASRVALSWTMPSGNAVPVQSWELEHSANGVNWSRLATAPASDGMSYTHSGLSPGDFRHYRVRAVTALGHGPWSESATATTAAGAPRLTASANGPNEIALSWSKPGGDAEIFEYQIERKTEGIDWVHHAVVYPETGTSWVDAGLTAGGTWSYRVRAISLSGGHTLEGEWSAEASATTDSGGPANAPTGLTATADGENRIDLSWTAPAAGGGSVTGYRVEHSTDEGESKTWERVATLGNVTSYSHTGLMSGTDHYYRVAALSGRQGGPFSDASSVATTAGTPTTVPGMPEDLRVTGVDRNRVSIAWSPPADNGGARVTGYEYRYWGPCAPDPNDLCESESRRVSGTAVTVSGLNVAGTYDFRVRAVNAVGAGEWADPVQADIAPPPAQGKVVVSPASLTLTEGGSATYRVRLSSNPTQPVQVSLFAEDPDGVLNDGELAGQQRMLLLPSNYAPPEGALWDGWAYRWNVGIPITVEAVEDDDTEDGTAVIHHDVWTAPADVLGNPPGWAEDPVYHGMTGPAVKVTVRDND